MTPGYEILMGGPMSQVGRNVMTALYSNAPEGTRISEEYVGDKEVLVLYGASHYVDRLVLMRDHMASGGKAVAWDMGYWQREDSLRFALNGLHPSLWQLSCTPDHTRRLFKLRQDANPDGPVVLVGLGARGSAIWYERHGEWEEKALGMIKSKWPGKEIVYRPRGLPFLSLPDTRLVADGWIEDVLKGASMVVCRHSNVAVDACIAGIPVTCEEGAARILYEDNPYASIEQRREFLQKLAWFNWSAHEAPQAWRFIGRLLKCVADKVA